MDFCLQIIKSKHAHTYIHILTKLKMIHFKFMQVIRIFVMVFTSLSCTNTV